MGCCASNRPQTNEGQEKPDPNQPTVVTNANTSINNQVVAESAHPPQPPQPPQQDASAPAQPNPSAITITYGKEHHSNIVASDTSKVKIENPKLQSHVGSHLKNQNEPPRLVELDHAKEFASHIKANGNTRIHEKIHGEEQVLETYHQNFEIPIFEVALTAH